MRQARTGKAASVLAWYVPRPRGVGKDQPNTLSKQRTVRCSRLQYSVLVLLLVVAEVTATSITLAREDAVNFVLHEMWHDASDELRNNVQEVVRGVQ